MEFLCGGVDDDTEVDPAAACGGGFGLVAWDLLAVRSPTRCSAISLVFWALSSLSPSSLLSQIRGEGYFTGKNKGGETIGRG